MKLILLSLLVIFTLNLQGRAQNVRSVQNMEIAEFEVSQEVILNIMVSAAENDDIAVGFDQTHYSVCDESTIKLCMNALSGVEPMTDLVLAVELGYKGGVLKAVSWNSCSEPLDIDDDIQFTVTIRNIALPQHVQLQQDTATVSISENHCNREAKPTEVQMTASSYSVGESGGQVSVCIEVEHGLLRQNFTISLQTEDGTADSGVDYNARPIESIDIIENSGIDTTCRNISVINDDCSEPEEMFQVSLVLEDGIDDVMIKIPSVNITIIDDDLATGQGAGAKVSLTRKFFKPGNESDSVEVCADVSVSGDCECPLLFSDFTIKLYSVVFIPKDGCYVYSPDPPIMNFVLCQRACVSVPITPDIRAAKVPFFLVLLKPSGQDNAISIRPLRQVAQVNI